MKKGYLFFSLFLSLILLITRTGKAQEDYSITAGFDIIENPYCEGETFVLPFTVSREFNSGNEFSVEMGDTVNGFARPIILGRVGGRTSGSITCRLPEAPDMRSCSDCIIRIVSTRPAVASQNAPASIIFNPKPKATIYGLSSPCKDGVYKYKLIFSSDNQRGITYRLNWKITKGHVLSYGKDTVNVEWDSTAQGNVGVYIEYSNGCEDSLNMPVFILTPPEASIRVVGEGGCHGTTALEALPDIKGLDYWWSTGQRGQVIYPDTTGWYWVIVVKPGCPPDTAKVFIQINPELKATMTATLYGLCQNDSAILRVFPDSTYYTSFKYIWSTGETTSSIKIKSPGTYVATVINNIGCRKDFSIKIDSLPEVRAKIIVHDENSFCDGDSAILEATPGGAGYRYLWSTGQSGRKITVKKAGRYFVKVQNESGCYAFDTTNIYVTSEFAARIDVKGYSYFCEGDSTVLSAMPHSHGFSCLWSTGDTTFSITARKAGKYIVTVMNSSGCKKSDTINIDVYPIPECKIVADGPTVFCDGDSVILRVEPYDKECIYHWSNGKTTSSIVVKSPGTYSVTAESPYLCRAGDSITVSIAPSIEASIKTSTGKKYICEGESITLTAEPTGDSYSYLWSTGDTASSINVSSAGRYTVSVSLGESCKGTGMIDIEVLPLPVVSIEGDMSICKGRGGALRASREFSSYKWSGGETTREIKISDPGIYSVSVTDSNGCSARAETEVKESDVVISHISDVDFGSVCSGEEAIREINFRNEDNETVSIKDISVKDLPQVFKIMNTTVEVKSGEEVKIQLSFRPPNVGIYEDTLLIETELPCKRITKAFMKASARAKTFAWLPDMTAAANTLVDIPLRLRLTCGNAIPGDAKFKAEISYKANVLQALDQDSGVTDKGISSSGEGIFAINGRGLETKSVKALTLITIPGFTPLNITRFSWNNSLIENETRDGSLEVPDICLQRLLKIKNMILFGLSVVPNPASDKAEIIFEQGREGGFSIGIYTLEGIRKEFRQVEGKGNRTQIELDLKEYGAGVYQVVVYSEGNVFAEKMVVVK